MNKLRDLFFDGLVSETQLKKAKLARKKSYTIEIINPKLLSEYEEKGWELHKSYARTCHVKKNKPIDVLLEDKVWGIFADMGFDFLNSGRFFKLPYSDDYSLTQQIDVIAIDQETIIIVECKAATKPTKGTSFKESIEALSTKREGITHTLRKIFPGSKHKIKFIYATDKYILSKPDAERLEHFDIIHFDEESVDYYQRLTKHLGHAAKYQMLGTLFEGQKIPEINNKVPCIKGKLGPHKFYSFSIEPERLLKIGYVLHRTKANKRMMPTYQRIIKKPRLKKIEEFINGGGFFPNSIIINIDSKKPLLFEPSKNQCEGGVCKIGVLSLPKKYRSAFIIDGQHRVYAYANSEHKTNTTIPVVAFENLKRTEQVEMFMQINENQKAVPKDLRNTLNADLLWKSSNLTEAMKALKLRISQELGEELGSPLYDRVIIGENKKSKTRCITIDTLYTCFNRSNFFGTVTKDAIKEVGSFYDSNFDTTFERVAEYLICTLDYIRDNLEDEWNLGENDDGFLTINPTIYCLILLMSDIVDHLLKNDELNTRTDTPEYISKETIPYMDPVIRYFKDITIDDKIVIRKSYGTGGKTTLWRKLQQIIKSNRDEFNPEGLDEYIRDSSKHYNTQSFELIRDIETKLKKDIKDDLYKAFEESWWKKGVPLQVYEAAELLTSKKNREREIGNEVEPWDQLHLIDYRKIILSHWRVMFEKKYAFPGVRGKKEDKTKWLVKLGEIRNENVHTYSVTQDEYNQLVEIHEWLISED